MLAGLSVRKCPKLLAYFWDNTTRELRHIMTQNELLEYLTQHALPGGKWGEDCNTPPTPSIDFTVFSHLDYLTIRYPEPKRMFNSQFPRYPYPEDLFQVTGIRGGAMGYRYGANLKPAGVFVWGSNAANTGSILELKGEALHECRKAWGMTDDELLHRLMKPAETVTRLDFCTNINAGSPESAMEAWDKGEIKTRARSGLDYLPRGEARGATCRVGSDKSNKFVRIYDKAAELKLLHTVLTRIELETAHRPADRLARTMLEKGVKATGKSVIAAFVDFPTLEWYKAAVWTPDTVNAELTPREKGNVATWLRDYVGPAIVKAYERGEYTAEIRDWLYEMHEFTRGRGYRHRRTDQ